MPKFKLLITLLNLPRLLLHLLVFSLCYKKCEDDVRANMEHHGITGSITMGYLYLLVFDKCYRTLFYWRIGNIKYLIYYWLPPHPCFTLATNMSMVGGIKLIHPFSTIINANSIGKNFVVRNNVTIGNNRDGERPVIGNDVIVNANAVVVGDIAIGNNVIIGAGAVVTKSIPDNCVVVGNPSYILKENGVIVKRPL